MPGSRRTLTSYILLAMAMILPVVLVLHAIFTARELRKMGTIFLRDRAAGVAARLETIPADRLGAGHIDEILESDPALLAVRIFHAADPDSGDPAIQAIRSGKALYRTEDLRVAGQPAFRAYVPFHSGSAVHIARIDLAGNAPDFILAHARHNLILSVAGGAVLLLVGLYGVWATRRAARLERERLETERLAELGRLSAGLAHEIRNPLGAIKGFAQLAREHAEPSRMKPLDAIIRETRRLENLVNALLLYGRPLKPVFRQTDWEAVAADLAAHAREQIGTRAIRFTRDSRVRELRTDPDLLKQALLNLIRNSVEAVGEAQDAEVRLRAAAGSGGAVVISVEDNGPGIPEAVRSRLFSPFLTTKASGTGLGLSISKKVVESLGGSLRLVSIAPHGTRAEVALHGTDSGH